jgi:epoxyqueuosine reductase
MTVRAALKPELLPTMDEIVALAADHGIMHVGVASADVLADTRQTLVERKEAGLHDGMQFTYRNPERSTDPQRAVPGAQSVIVGARPYLTEEDPPVPTAHHGAHARVGRYSWVDHYQPLRDGLQAIGERITDAGFRAAVFVDDNAIVDRAIAHRAGIGWFGKNANLLLPGAGSYFVLGSLVTTAMYEPSGESVSDGCGSCVRCIDGCPTGAIVAPGVIDGARCLSWVLQKAGPIPLHLRVAVHDRIYGCDDCQDVCPISVRLGPRNTVDVDGDVADMQSHVDMLELLDADDEWINQQYGRWYIAGREFRWLRRNALVVIGNVANPADSRVRSIVERYRFDSDPILAEHADWARQRLDERLVSVP